MNNVNEDSPIVFRMGEESKPVIYDIDNYNQSIFSPQLSTFFSYVKRKFESFDDVYAEKIFNDMYDNNIIAFIGERGSGKTSCMYSAIKIMKEAQDKNRWRELIGDGNVRSVELRFMRTIDPSCFDEQHNILEILIGQMYHEANAKFESDKEKRNRNGFHDLLTQFQKTKRHLRFLSREKPLAREDDELEELGYLSSGVDLCESIKTLVARFLEYMGGRMLVIGIDDIDLNTSQAYSMVEQVRKYLILPHVMILVAVKLDQLGDVIRVAMTKQFKDIMHDGYGAVTEADVSEMVERYLNKLLPLQSRIYLPQPSAFYNRKLKVQDKKDKELMSYDSIREAVPALIFEKCRYLFYNTKGTTSLIVPRNLRDLRMLIRMLVLMNDYDQNDITPKLQENKQQFKNYFFSTWLDDLNVHYKNIANELINETEPILFNKKVLELLKKETISDTDHAKENSIVSDILNHNNMSYNISIGDAFYVLRQYEDMETSAEFRKLLFFIKSLYSIRLYEYYDELVANETKEKKNSDVKNPYKLYRGQQLEHTSNYEKMIGGGFFLLNGDTLLPKENGNLEREIRNVKGGKLMEMIDSVVRDYDGASDKSRLFEEDKDFVTRLKVVEFFMLTISRYIWTTDNNLVERGIHKYRLQPKAYYDRSFDTNTKSMKFDALTPFFSLIDIKHSFNRFNEKLFTISMECENSLYNQLKKRRKGDDREFLSRVSLRNAEIIDDLFVRMQEKRGTYRMNDNAKVLKAFYKDLAAYEIYTYDKNQNSKEDGEPYYKITFPEFDILLKLFDDALFVKYFNEVYKIQSDEMQMVEDKYSQIWGDNKGMLGKKVVEGIGENYPKLYNVITHDEWKNKFVSEKRYSKKQIISIITSIESEFKEEEED